MKIKISFLPYSFVNSIRHINNVMHRFVSKKAVL
jgi:hypothetical protein